MKGFFKFGKKARKKRGTQRNKKVINAAKNNPSNIIGQILARQAMQRKAGTRRSATHRSAMPGLAIPISAMPGLATHRSATHRSATHRSAMPGLATGRSRRSIRPPSLFPGMLTPNEFAAETKRIKKDLKEAETKHRKALAAQQRANEMENGEAKEAANKAVDKAKTEIDLLMEQMSKLMSS